jgi:hypothetical protein
MILAHLLGDYIFQWGVIARWKSQSLNGVLAHGCIITLSALACTGLTVPEWWPYALLIGLTHTAIDVIRARFVQTSRPTRQMAWYLLDQGLHAAIIVLTVLLAGDTLVNQPTVAAETLGAHHTLASAPNAAVGSAPRGPLSDQRFVWLAIGYIVLLQPAWVFLRFVVRGVWGADAAPPLDHGNKYRPMVERVLIATSILAGAFYLVPLVVLPSYLKSVDLRDNRALLTIGLPAHLAEPVLSFLLAVGVGLGLRIAL